MSDYLERIAALPPEKLALLAADNPLSYGQRRLWFLSLLSPDSAAYNIPAALRLTGELDPAALGRSLDRIVARHEILRTTFWTPDGRTVDGQPIQIVHPERPVEIVKIDLSSLPAPERERQAREAAEREARQPFDLERGPLLRVGLIKLAEREHVLLVTMHHIVSDGWSSGILVKELSHFYNAFSQGQSPTPPELPIQYADYAVWEREWLGGEVFGRQLEYWKKKLGTGGEAIALPYDRPRPATPSHRGARLSLNVPREVYGELKKLCRREEATLHMALLAGFKLLLSRYSGQQEISVGTAVANRRLVESEGLIGFFVNTVVMRTDLRGAGSYLDVLRLVKETALGAYAHQEAPFEKLVEELKLERSLSHNPLFQVSFDLKTDSGNEVTVNGLRIDGFEFENPIAKFDLYLTMAEADGELWGTINYNTDLFERETIERTAGHYARLLGEAARNPERRLWELEYLTEVEKRQVTEEWNRTAAPYEEEKTIHELVREQAGRTPEALAVVSGERRLTYRQLDERSDRLAGYLIGRGIGPERPVAVCLERSPELVIGLLGALKAGGVYVPVDPKYPADRIAYILRDSRAQALLTQQSLSASLPESGAEVICLDADFEAIASRPTGAAADVAPENLAYVIYTSGSTGTPKGVAVAHKSLCNLAAAQSRVFGVGVGSRVLQFASLSFDASVWEIFMALTAGATLHLGDRDTVFSGAALAQLLRDQEINVATLPPAALSTLPYENLPALQTIISAGEKCPAETYARWSEGRRFFNAYGPTETTVCASMLECQGRYPDSQPIGRPLANTQIYLLDSHLRPVPVNARGELYVGGAALSRGYLNQPARTAEKFVPNPFSTEPGARLYRTGDLARYLIDGNIEYLGRADNQVKIRGFRIELGEVEAALAAHPAVGEAVVLAREDEPGEKRLVAYVRTRGESGASAGELRSFLRERLPDYMTPSAFVLVDEFPQTPNGKIDHKALPAPERSRKEAAAPFLAPGTPMEQKVAAIWREVLRLDQVGVDDNFFDLGGHSLLAVSVHERIRKEIKPELPLLKLFQYPTVRTLAEFLGAEREAPAFTRDSTQDWADRRKQAFRRQRQIRSQL